MAYNLWMTVWVGEAEEVSFASSTVAAQPAE
jgi:hypothetical protein